MDVDIDWGVVADGLKAGIPSLLLALIPYRLLLWANAGANKVKSAQDLEYQKQASKLGRNALCPCGSGKKAKLCHAKKKVFL